MSPRENEKLILSMARGSFFLRPLIEKYSLELQGALLEVGPLSTPLLWPSPRRDAEVVYWENDEGALLELRKEQVESYPLPVDLDAADSTLQSLAEKNRKLISLLYPGKYSYRVAVLSQILNYVDFRRVIALVASLQQTGDLLFVNNPLGGVVTAMKSVLDPTPKWWSRSKRSATTS